MARIVLNTFGSFGDLHPYLAVAIGLKQHGHQPVVATAEVYRSKVEAEGIAFAPVRPDIGDMAEDKAFLQKIWHPQRGTEFLIRDYIMPAVKDSFEDLSQACKGADLLLTHAAAYAGPVVGEYLKMRWLSVVLQPAAFLSRYDPPVLPPAPWLPQLKKLGNFAVSAVLHLGRLRTNAWAKPVADLRKKLGLRPAGNPMFEGQFSPFGTLAWFSESYASAQLDWPARTVITGFPFYDQLGAGFQRWTGSLSDDTLALQRFLAEGHAPVLFTLGSSAVMEPGSFYRESFRAAQALGIRAILLAGAMTAADFPQPLPESIYIASYAPYSQVMPQCSALVHQGGIGTTAQALRAGRPMIVVPWAHDQPDNAARVQRLGSGKSIPRNQYTEQSAARTLQDLLSDSRYNTAATSIAGRIGTEDGIERACNAIDEFLS